jgi:hypothetical protein
VPAGPCSGEQPDPGADFGLKSGVPDGLAEIIARVRRRADPAAVDAEHRGVHAGRLPAVNLPEHEIGTAGPVQAQAAEVGGRLGSAEHAGQQCPRRGRIPTPAAMKGRPAIGPGVSGQGACFTVTGDFRAPLGHAVNGLDDLDKEPEAGRPGMDERLFHPSRSRLSRDERRDARALLQQLQPHGVAEKQLSG